MLTEAGLKSRPLFFLGGETPPKHAAEPRDCPCRPRAPQMVGGRVRIRSGVGLVWADEQVLFRPVLHIAGAGQTEVSYDMVACLPLGPRIAASRFIRTILSTSEVRFGGDCFVDLFVTSFNGYSDPLDSQGRGVIGAGFAFARSNFD